MVKSGKYILSFLFIPVAVLWCSAVQAEPVLNGEIQDLSLEAAEKNVLETQIAQGFGGIKEIPFSARKGTKPEGDIRVGRFEIYPSAGISYSYDDNIFLEADQNFSDGSFESPTSDSIYILKGSLGVSKELKAGDAWGFNFFYEAQDENFVKTDRENFLQHDLDTQVTLAGLGGRTQISLFWNILNTTDIPSSEFASNFNPRSEHTVTELGERFRWALTPRTLLSLDGEIEMDRFETNSLQGEDKNDFIASASVLWAWTTLTSFGMSLDYENTHYTAPQTTNADTKLYGFFVIAKFEPSALVSGDLGIGYQKRFVSGGGNSREGFSYKMNLAYDMSDRTRFVLSGERSIQDSTFSTVAVHTATALNIAWEQQWPMFPKIGTRVLFGFSNLDYDEAIADNINGGGAIKNRSDDITNAGFDLIYDIQKWLKVELEFLRIENSSNFDSLDYTSNVLTLSAAAVF